MPQPPMVAPPPVKAARFARKMDVESSSCCLVVFFPFALVPRLRKLRLSERM